MKRKYIVIVICLVIVLFLGVLISYRYFKNNSKVEEFTGVEKLVKKLEAKDDMLIYVTDKNCDLCKPIDKMIKFYEKAYNLDFYYAENENLTRDNLIEYFELPDGAIEFPAVIYIRDGLIKGIDNRIMSEFYFRDYLIEYGFIDKSYYENDYKIDYEEFKERFSSSEKQILFFYNYGSNVYSLGEAGEKKEFADADKLRLELVKLSRVNQFKYRVIFYDSVGSDKIYAEIISALGNKIVKGPFIVITENNKVVDYLALKKVSSVSKFLEKNGIISGN